MVILKRNIVLYFGVKYTCELEGRSSNIDHIDSTLMLLCWDKDVCISLSFLQKEGQ